MTGNFSHDNTLPLKICLVRCVLTSFYQNYDNIDLAPIFPVMPTFLALIPILLTLMALSLTIWSVIPAPNMTLLPLSVGAPEISIWLWGFSVTSLASYAVFRHAPLPQNRHWLGIGLSVISIALSASPLLQISTTIDRANNSITKALGNNYLANIPSEIQATFRSPPFSIPDALQGIKLSQQIRIQRHLQFATPAGVPLTLNLYQPPNLGQYPAVIQIYGGAWRTGTPDSNEEFSRYLAARGYVVIAIDYRHAPQHHFPAQLIDMRTALAYVRQQATNWEIDLERLALIGRSSGGHLATLAAYETDALPIKAVVSYYAPVDLTAGYADPPTPDPIDSRQVLRDFLGGTPAEFPELYRQASPYQLVDRPLPPTLLIYGGQDHLVEARFGQRLAKKLQSLGTPTVYIEIPWANHAFDVIFNGPSNQLALYYTERFLAYTLRLGLK
jgi:acetyl esterase/lipase